ncbi:hypothetical protein [Beijerinckia sp. L45]|uniref:hypothetical protein n=1 Tax=Beijerinckia sp. L45 TaxID=1641855 RepID=UPI00131C9A03|nr:hypothetical protein [Beijerinckia sp. L45]
MSEIDIKDHERYTDSYRERTAFHYVWNTLGGVLFLVMIGTVLVVYASLLPASAATAAEASVSGSSGPGVTASSAADTSAFYAAARARFAAVTGREPTVRDHVTVDFRGNGYRGQVATVGVYRGESGIRKDHNGSDVLVFEKAGLIVYAKPKPAMAKAVRPGDVLFRGVFSKTETTGMAYAFKVGCTPVPYMVSYKGTFIDESTADLKGPAPRWSKSSCDIIGFSKTVPNAKLTFGWIPGDEYVED